MTVAELIEALQKEDPARLVVMASDGEGNGYSPLRRFWTGAYREVTPYSGDVGLERLTDEGRKSGYSEEDVVKGVPALVLVPMN